MREEVMREEKEDDWCSIAGCSIAFTLCNLSCIGRKNISFLAVREWINHM